MKRNAKAAQRVDMVVVGAGFGGMYATWKFREMGLDLIAIEEGGDVGRVAREQQIADQPCKADDADPRTDR